NRYPAAVARRRRSRLARWFERVALGAIMGGVAFVVERRLMKAIRRRGTEGAPPGGGEAELTTAPEQVDQ
ncbi:MAG TPA: hypothetical protein VHH92_03845, partial [Actinomycetota bacterium]|nr:hypothetical protein [Actinomycetota bacterium]